MLHAIVAWHRVASRGNTGERNTRLRDRMSAHISSSDLDRAGSVKAVGRQFSFSSVNDGDVVRCAATVLELPVVPVVPAVAVV
jgi:hypothetical protein